MSFLQDVQERLKTFIAGGLEATLQERMLPLEDYRKKIELEEPRRREHGDFACNIAMVLAGELKASPRQIANEIIENLPMDAEQARFVAKVEIAGPGFINIFLKEGWLAPLLHCIEKEGENYGRSRAGEGKKVQVEFVSANPTGPLHVGHTRGAVVGDTLANLLSFCGCEVEKEFYVNNAGHQMDLLGRSIYLRLLQKKGEEVQFPADGYQGEYIKELARQIMDKYGSSLEIHPEQEREVLCREFGYQELLKKIKEDLQKLGIKFDRWFSERSLYEDGLIEKALNLLKKKRHLYEKEGATWFASSRFGDEKDRVVIKSDGNYTYFAADLAYHLHKLERGFDLIIDVLGADHHGHIARMKAGVAAFGYDPEQLKILILQTVNLLRGGKNIPMSKRAGEFVTLGDILKEVGRDPIRYFYLTRSNDSTIDFDLELAREQSASNPVYYLQYVHARICSLFARAKEMGLEIKEPAKVDISLLQDDLEDELLRKMARFPGVVLESYEHLSPHYLTVYGHELAQAFHVFYNKCPVMGAEEEKRSARLALVWGARQVLRNLLQLMGVSAPKEM